MKKLTRHITFDCTDDTFDKWIRCRKHVGKKAYEVGIEMVDYFAEKYDVPEKSQNGEIIKMDDLAEKIAEIVNQQLERLLK